MAGVSTPWYVARTAYAVLISLFLAALIVQVYLAGRMVFGVAPLAVETANEGSLHEYFGWQLAHMFAIFPFLLGFFTRGGKRVWITNIVWAVCVFMLPMLAAITYVEPGSGDAVTEAERNIAAFHPVLALVVLGLTAFLSYASLMLVREGRTLAEPSPAPRKAAPRAPRL